MRLVFDEAKKHRAFREAWIGYILGGLYLLLAIWQFGPVTSDYWGTWYSVQQDIYAYGANFTAFLLVVGLPRLVCYERENRTESLIRVSNIGCFYTWKSKALYSVFYCAAVVIVVGVSSVLIHCGSFGFEGALSPMEASVYFQIETMPSLPNIVYCVLQYVFLFGGALYFAGFVLLVSAITKRTALSIFLCGGSYVVCAIYEIIGHRLPMILRRIIDIFYQFGFGGYLRQESFSWNGFPTGVWEDVWKPVLLLIVMIALEFSAFWFVWRRKATK